MLDGIFTQSPFNTKRTQTERMQRHIRKKRIDTTQRESEKKWLTYLNLN